MSPDRRRFLIGLGATPLALGAGVSAASAQAPEKKSIPDFPERRDVPLGRPGVAEEERFDRTQDALAAGGAEPGTARLGSRAPADAGRPCRRRAFARSGGAAQDYELRRVRAHLLSRRKRRRPKGVAQCRCRRTHISVGHVGLIEVAAKAFPTSSRPRRNGPMERPAALFACAIPTGSRATPISRCGTAGFATSMRPPAGASWTSHIPARQAVRFLQFRSQ